MSLHPAPIDTTALRTQATEPGASWHRVDVVEETGSTNADLLSRAGAGPDIDRTARLLAAFIAGDGEALV